MDFKIIWHNRWAIWRFLSGMSKVKVIWDRRVVPGQPVSLLSVNAVNIMQVLTIRIINMHCHFSQTFFCFFQLQFHYKRSVLLKWQMFMINVTKTLSQQLLMITMTRNTNKIFLINQMTVTYQWIVKNINHMKTGKIAKISSGGI